MKSVFQEIENLRDGSSINMIESILNRYTVVCQESDRTHTAYCFSVPIRNVKTNDVVDMCFHHNKYVSVFTGSEAKITIDDKARLVNRYGRCDIIFQSGVTKKTANAVYLGKEDCFAEICPTLNGLMIIMDYNPTQYQSRLILNLDRIFESTRTNGKYFSIMRDKFIPFITVSCMGVINNCGEVIAPCEVDNQKISDVEYALTFSTKIKNISRIAVEINMQETKLFQDTTVESQNPKLNNAFGGVAFLGKSKYFGEQWLYSRLEMSNISQFHNKKILKTVLHIPKIGHSMIPLTVNQISSRFCSFGSNWQNKIAVTNSVSESSISNGYYHFDVTKLFGNLIKKSENFVIRGKSTNTPTIISTGDNFYAPQILEVKYQ